MPAIFWQNYNEMTKFLNGNRFLCTVIELYNFIYNHCSFHSSNFMKLSIQYSFFRLVWHSVSPQSNKAGPQRHMVAAKITVTLVLI